MNSNRNFRKGKPAKICRRASEQHMVTILSGIYLDAGLPLEAAVRSAIADYECSFSQVQRICT